ncbi:TPA: hypothetical protein DEO28_00955 [Candidatus Dependentiae bacterium]|nr:MAG: CutA1 divalent ion tolerance protein [candidate division TM6 bacterium GW2011_GWE2_31_21]KKP54161.1 MAG: CutA1 divalent ion tolerance protein [candidate division TM6 bacterium GW2011_GWF2_33_332]HBS47883.1 hypothetical protein [Candidatus Dependentiae bacterium]HBZ73068.1 hypothetical protein [Candidatus Dependentiae bacterium]
MTKFIEVITTFEKIEETKKIATMIIENKLAGCCSIKSIESIYRWEGKIESAQEFQLTIKTKESLYKELEDFIVKNHCYQTPQIIALPIVNGFIAYLNWIEKETK